MFVISTFLIGIILNILNLDFESKPAKKYNYEFLDTLFKRLNSEHILEETSTKILEKRVDSDQELYDFSNDKKDVKKDKSVEVNFSKININTADNNLLTELPGIGEKTAEKIIALRNKKNGFNALDELKEVKGIGDKKFDKIKNLIKIEK